MAFVYWIRREFQTDIFKEGYVGVTITTVNKRYAAHKSSAKTGSSLHVHRALRKYTDFVVETVIEGSEEYCYLIEGKLRPSPGIGYNSAVGGEISPMTGKKHTKEVVEQLREISKKRMENPETRKALSEAVKGFKHTAEAKEKISLAGLGRKHSQDSIEKMKLSQKERYTPKSAWETPRADKEMWSKSLEIFDFMQTKKRVGWKSTAHEFQTTKTKVKTICQKIKDGWNPRDDTSFLVWLGAYNLKKEA